MNPEDIKENKPEGETPKFLYKIDEEEMQIYLGGDSEKVGEFLGRLDIEMNCSEQDPQKRKRELNEKIQKWKSFLQTYTIANYQERKKMMGSGQLNFSSHRVLIMDPGSPMLERSGLKTPVKEGKESTMLFFQYLFNGQMSEKHFREIKETFEKIRADMKK